MKNLLSTICEEYGYVTPNNKSGITLEMLLLGSLSGNIVTYVRSLTGCAKQTVTNVLSKAFPDRDPIHDRGLVNFLLSKWELKFCSSCKEVKDLDEYYFNSSKVHGTSDVCKECSKQSRKDAYAKDPQKEIQANDIRKRRKNELQTPIWANTDVIAEFYRNRPEGMHVDHIEPLNGEFVCGLHVIDNLQYLPAQENLSKGNKQYSAIV